MKFDRSTLLLFAIIMLIPPAPVAGDRADHSNLIHTSEVITDVTDWHTSAAIKYKEYNYEPTTFYRWIDADRILNVRRHDSGWNFLIYNRSTKTYTPLTALDTVFNESLRNGMRGDNGYWPPDLLKGIEALEISKTGQILWTTEAKGAYACTLTGTNIRKWPGVESAHIGWTADSQWWYSLPMKTVEPIHAIIYDADNEGGPIWNLTLLNSPVAMGDRDILVLDCDLKKRLLYRIRRDGFWTPQAEIHVFDLRNVTEKVVKFRLPEHNEVVPNGIRISPRLDQISWLLTRGTGETQQTHLFVSDMRGRNWKDLGALPISSSNAELLNFQWLPDGKSFSFVYHDHLYVIPVQARKRTS